ncbi:MAG: hypothetical protein H6658_01950 [Ardenticatenaceae bacterium]|nr:hypothetical protein [Ardenticatenaceae bacterium]
MTTSTHTLTRSLQALAVFGSSWYASLELGYRASNVVNNHVARLELRCGLHLVRRDERGKRTAILNESGRDAIKLFNGGTADNRDLAHHQHKVTAVPGLVNREGH